MHDLDAACRCHEGQCHGEALGDCAVREHEVYRDRLLYLRRVAHLEALLSSLPRYMQDAVARRFLDTAITTPARAEAASLLTSVCPQE